MASFAIAQCINSWTKTWIYELFSTCHTELVMILKQLSNLHTIMHCQIGQKNNALKKQ